MKRKKILITMSLALMLGLVSNAFATKWVFRSLYCINGKLYAIEECVRRFLSTDGCTVGSQRMVPLDSPPPAEITAPSSDITSPDN